MAAYHKKTSVSLLVSRWAGGVHHMDGKRNRVGCWSAQGDASPGGSGSRSSPLPNGHPSPSETCAFETRVTLNLLGEDSSLASIPAK